MLKAISLEVKNIPCHGETKYDFDGGTTVIRGKNFSGKSVLFSTIGNLLFAAPPLITKANQAKLLVGKGAEVHFKCSLGDTVYVLSQTNPNGKSVRYGVNINGEDQEFKTIGAARDYIEKVSPITKEQFYSLFYLNAFRPHTLQYGSSPERRKFFEEVFSLDTLEFIYREVLDRQRPIKSALTALETKSSILADMPEPSLVTSIENNLKKLDRTISKQHNKFEKLTSIFGIIAERDSLLGSIVYNQSPKLLQSKLSSLQAKRHKIKRRLVKSQHLSERMEEYLSNKSKRKELERQLDEYSDYDVSDIAELKKKVYACDRDLTMLEDMLNKAEEKQKKLKALSEKKEAFTSAIDQLGKKCKSIEKARAMKDTYLSQIDAEKSLVSKLERIAEKASCPTCDQTLNPKQTKKLIARSMTEIRVLKTNVLDLNAIIAYYKAKGSLDITHKVSKPKVYRVKIKGVEATIQTTQTTLDMCNKKQRLLDKKSNLGEVRKPKENTQSPEVLSDRLENLDDTIKDVVSSIYKAGKLEELDKEHPTLSKYNSTSLQEKVLTLRKKLKILRHKSEAMASKVIRSTVEREAFDSVNTEVQALKDETKDAELYEILAECFGMEGIREQQINRLSAMYIDNMNKYAQLLYPAPISFAIRYTKSSFDIVAERQGRISDVSLLSGSESRCFQLLSILSILPIIPSDLRTDFLILDEMESGMSSEMRSKFSSSFLPKLNTVVKNLILITPMDQQDMFIDGAKEMRMEPTDVPNINALVAQ